MARSDPDRPLLRHLALATLIAAVAVTACGGNESTPGPGASAEASPGVTTSPTASGTATIGGSQGATDGTLDFTDIPALVAELEPSVVSIIREGGEGSGVVWDPDGLIVTNHHVIEGVTDVVVAFADGTREPGSVLASDPLSDLAVVKTDRNDLPAPSFAEEIPPVGTFALALGNPLGFENSATAGIVSGTHRAVPGAAQQAPALVDLIQTDAAISPGNSGGALAGPDGRIIGINVAFIPPQARAVSIGFAIPSPTVIDVVEQLIETGEVRHPYLGVSPVTLTDQIAQQFGLSRNSGALVVTVADGSPAADAGIEPGDVIVAIDDEDIRAVEDLLGALRQHRPGDEVTLQTVRGDQEQDVEVTLDEFPRQS